MSNEPQKASEADDRPNINTIAPPRYSRRFSSHLMSGSSGMALKFSDRREIRKSELCGTLVFYPNAFVFCIKPLAISEEGRSLCDLRANRRPDPEHPEHFSPHGIRSQRVPLERNRVNSVIGSEELARAVSVESLFWTARPWIDAATTARSASKQRARRIHAFT